MNKQDAINLLPPAYADDRGKYFAEIIWENTQTGSFIWRNEGEDFLIPAIAAFAPAIAPFSARLTINKQRELLALLPRLMRLGGTRYSLTKAMELFGYTVNLVENMDGVGTFKILVAQTFVLAEVSAIANTFKPIGRLLVGIQNFEAILLDGTRLFDGSTNL